MSYGVVHNYYEKLVIEKMRFMLDDAMESDYFADVACLALNQLKPKYVSSDVDAGFYLSADERELMDIHVAEAVDAAVEKIATH